MGTIFMNSGNSKTSHPHELLLNLSDKINLKWSDKCVALLNLSIYYTWKDIKKSYKNNKFKISAPTWKRFELPDGSDSVSYFKIILIIYIIKKHKAFTDNPPGRIYVNKIENRITFKIKAGYEMKLLGSAESKIMKDKNGENVPHLETAKVVLVHGLLIKILNPQRQKAK